ncbi:pseudaminic acid synthase [uncultured Clostridium sp.]|jgi:pseudaminic acid synthase|uniref:pseudaminic acid synthase n=1 Tax=uncultured Clostridium sp. TaxID=59620 RepID=UPI0026397604|nr:pseudaminic acid synthase [uncultured Clostridium sp.]
MSNLFEIDGVKIGGNEKCFIIAEMSANHMQNFDRAVEIIKKAKWAGADAIKLQTYTPDTITLDCDNEYFQIKQGTIWDGTTLHKLYQTAYTPWEWQGKLKEIAEEEGLVFFSSPFDFTSVDFLESIDIPAYKVASFEITDIPFIEYIAAKGKPVIMSAGIARLGDIQDAIDACYRMGNREIAILKCTSAYPAPVDEINLKTMVNMKETFNLITGLSDHTMGTTVSIASVAMGAKIVEKHLTLRREDGGADSQFSMEPEEFKEMVDAIRMTERAMGKVTYDLSEKQKNSREHSRSLFVVKDIKAGEVFTNENVKSIRPGFGIATKYINDILGKKSTRNIEKGTPVKWNLVDITEEDK